MPLHMAKAAMRESSDYTKQRFLKSVNEASTDFVGPQDICTHQLRLDRTDRSPRQEGHVHEGFSFASSTFSPYRMYRQSPQNTPYTNTIG